MQVTTRVPVIRRSDGRRADPAVVPAVAPRAVRRPGDPAAAAAPPCWPGPRSSLVLVVGFALAGWQLVMTALDGDGASGDDEPPAQSSSASSTAGPRRGRARRSATSLSFDPPPEGTARRTTTGPAARSTATARRCGRRRATTTRSGRPAQGRRRAGARPRGEHRRCGSVTVWTAAAPPTWRSGRRTSCGDRAGRLRPSGAGRRRRRAGDAAADRDPCARATCWSGSRRLPVADGSRYRGSIAEIAVRAADRRA